ncbi:MAG TPA: hypothetical protein ENN60_00250 [archaeon]|nr:hypothetical protein [archaeon]
MSFKKLKSIGEELAQLKRVVNGKTLPSRESIECRLEMINKYMKDYFEETGETIVDYTQIKNYDPLVDIPEGLSGLKHALFNCWKVYRDFEKTWEENYIKWVRNQNWESSPERAGLIKHIEVFESTYQKVT